MIKNQLYERPDITVLQLEENCVLLAGTTTFNVDGNKGPGGSGDGNPDKIDAKNNNIWGTNGLWND